MSYKHLPDHQHSSSADSAPLMERTPSHDISAEHPQDPADAPTHTIHSFRRLSIKAPTSDSEAEAGLSEKYYPNAHKLDAYNDRARAGENGGENGGAKHNRALLTAGIIAAIITMSLGASAAAEGASGAILIITIVIAVMGALKLLVTTGLLNENGDVTRTQSFYHLVAAIAWAAVGTVALVFHYMPDAGDALSNNQRRGFIGSAGGASHDAPSVEPDEYGSGGSSKEGSEDSYEAGEKGAELAKEIMESNLVVAAGIFAIVCSLVSLVQFFSSRSALARKRRYR